MRLSKEDMALLRENRTAFLVKAYLCCDSTPSTRECAELLGIGHTTCFRLMKRFGFGKNETPNETAFETANETPNETAKPRKIKASRAVSETPNETAFETPNETPNETAKPRKRLVKNPAPLTRYKAVFEARYRELTDMDFYWSPKEIDNLKQLVEGKLAFSMKKKGNEPTPEALVSSLDIFLRGITDPWYLSHLSPATLNSKYNDIVSHIRSEHQQKPATAAGRNQQNAHENEQLRLAIAERKRQRGEL